MKIETYNELELMRERMDVLTKNLPLSKVARLLSISRVGRGDYTANRRKLFAGETSDSLFAKARKHEKHNRKR